MANETTVALDLANCSPSLCELFIPAETTEFSQNLCHPYFQPISRLLDLETSLLQAPVSNSNARCQNSRYWPLGIESVLEWAPKELAYRRPLTAWSNKLDWSFLNVLGSFCIQSGVQNCQNPSCLNLRDVLDKFIPRDCGGWDALRKWILVVVSCGIHNNKEGTPWFDCLRRCKNLFVWWIQKPEICFDSLKGIKKDRHVDFFQVCEVVYWASGALSGFPLDDQGTHMIPKNYYTQSHMMLPAIHRAVAAMRKVRLCQARLWRVVKASPRQMSDLPAILDMLHHLNLDPARKHRHCTEDYCSFDHDNSTYIKQLHKCTQGVCPEVLFSAKELENAVAQDAPTVWTITSPPTVGHYHGGYMAVSHVWADGTGVGLKGSGVVNSCLFDYFVDIAKRLECNAIWWDTICVPGERQARRKVLNKMHDNFEQAKYTIVHDKSLVGFEWRDDGTICVALALSFWFTRGWTALELLKSRNVVVLFKDPNGEENDKKPLLKDLDTEILAQKYTYIHPAHQIASMVIRKLRHRGGTPFSSLETLFSILEARVTSWPRDLGVIAALIAGVRNFDSSASFSQIARRILFRNSLLNATSLLHGQITISESGPWSWCPRSIFHLQLASKPEVQSDTSYCQVYQDGSVTAYLLCRPLSETDTHGLRPYCQQMSVQLRIMDALKNPNKCLLLQMDYLAKEVDLFLLVTTVGCDVYENPTVRPKLNPVVECRYVGPVSRSTLNEKVGAAPCSDAPSAACHVNIRLGADKGQKEVDADEMLHIYKRNHEELEDHAHYDRERDRWTEELVDLVVPKKVPNIQIHKKKGGKQRRPYNNDRRLYSGTANYYQDVMGLEASEPEGHKTGVGRVAQNPAVVGGSE